MMSALGRRQKQWKNGHAHLAVICGHHVRGGRPIYRRAALVSVAEAIQRERMKAIAEKNRKAKKK